MPSRFARVVPISRNRDGNAVKAAAYQARAVLTDERTGLRYNSHSDGDLAHHEILLPEGADRKFTDPQTLWSAVEIAERRKDSNVARQIILRLPPDSELPADARIDMVRSFVQEHFVSKGLAAQIDFHSPKRSDNEEDHNHAHVLLTTRRVDGDHLEARKAPVMVPDFRQRAGGKPLIVEAESWHDLWAEHQNRFYQDRRIDLTVDPPAPFSRPGMRRFFGAIAALKEVHILKRLNEYFARDPAKVFQHLRDQPAGFDPRAADRFVDKHIPDALGRSIVRKNVRQMWQADLVEKTKVPTINAIARELSPRLAKLEDRANVLRRQMHKIEWGRGRSADRRADADRRLADRWSQMGSIRRLLHLTRLREDLETRALKGWKRGQEYGGNKLGIRYATARDRLAAIEPQIKIEFEKIKDAAVAELVRRRAIAKHAREQLEQLAAQASLQQAPRQVVRLRPPR